MKKIALIVDADNWAFANIARNVVKRLSHKYDFMIIPAQYVEDNFVKIWLMVQEFDLVHFFWRGHLLFSTFDNFDDYILSLKGNPTEFRKKYIESKNISTDVYDHLYIENEKELETTQTILSFTKQYYVSSKKLLEIYNKLPISSKPWGVITDGVDLEKFYPINLERLKHISQRKLIIGWVGNSDWQGSGTDHKGVNTILKPVINDLIKDGYPIEMYFADRNERMIPHNEMTDYYSKIDLYICTSLNEGTPNPVLEAMACGIPVISTDVGIVSDLFGEVQRRYILEERTKKDLKEKLIYLLEHMEDLEIMSKENLEEIKKWTWDEKAKDFEKFFDYCLEKS